ncbi:DUF996 domain-containing protein [Marinitoga sp. 1155]|uniref:DUF996 domain-containing protein n=1 Tax=Marinitoga sp. 1155 TaxID=1428448 RepID=UPI000640BD18|nr:DUF996 domain-containing protein [Marinitoga sp. 1155]KLO24758.1 hypothetical protein X274_01980 [Marinitoga sp. 1155]
MNLKNTKILAGVGRILGMFGHFGILGIILELIGVYKISEAVKDKRIFNYLLLSEVVIYIIYFVGFLGIFGSFFRTVIEPDMYIMSNMPNVFLMLVIYIAAMIIPVIYKIKVYNLMGDYFGNDNFYKASKFLFWGIILSIVLVGFILTFVANIFAIIGYFTLPDEYPENIISENDNENY